MEKYAVVFPEVEFTIEDIHENKAASNEERIIRILKVFSASMVCLPPLITLLDPFYACFISAYLRSCFGGGRVPFVKGHFQKYECESLQNVEEIDVIADSLKIHGFISLVASYSKVMAQKFRDLIF